MGRTTCGRGRPKRFSYSDSMNRGKGNFHDCGGPDDSGIWKCMGSWTVIGTMHETNPPESWTETPMSPFGIPDCVLATDEVDARGRLCFAVK